MTQVYCAVIFAGRVLYISNTSTGASTFRDDWLKNCDPAPDQKRVTIRALPYPATTTAEAAFAWINSLLSGSVLDTIDGQEVA